MKLPEGDLYVSSIEGHIVGRPGSATRTTKAHWIGARPKLRTLSNGTQEITGEIEWLPNEVHRIPAAEVQRHLHAWMRIIDAGSLKLRSAKDFDAFTQAQEAESAKHASPEQNEKDRLATRAALIADGISKAIAAGELDPTDATAVAKKTTELLASKPDAQPVKSELVESDVAGTGGGEVIPGGIQSPRGDEKALPPPAPAAETELVDANAPAKAPAKTRRTGAGSDG